MNSIHGYISDVIKKLTELYRTTNNKDWESAHVFSDVYDLVFSLWGSKTIEDSSLAMGILKYYYDYKKYGWIEPESYINYPQIESEAKGIRDELIRKLDNLM